MVRRILRADPAILNVSCVVLPFPVIKRTALRGRAFGSVVHAQSPKVTVKFPVILTVTFGNQPMPNDLVLPIEPTSNAAGVNATWRREGAFFLNHQPMEAER
jgi:hypothetical protein